jgi:hypothetical protein
MGVFLGLVDGIKIRLCSTRRSNIRLTEFFFGYKNQFGGLVAKNVEQIKR